MSSAGKTKNSTQRAKGKVDEAAGTATGHSNVPAEGKEKMNDNLQQAGYVSEDAT